MTPVPTAGPVALSDAVELVPLDRLRPALLNDEVYRPVDPTDPTIAELHASVAAKGVLEPLVAATDDVLVSGHRRRAAAQLAGLVVVPVRRISIASADPRFPDYLVAFNQQRYKTAAEAVREEVARTAPGDAYGELLAHRAGEAARAYLRVEDAGLRVLDTAPARVRAVISGAKRPMLDAAAAILERYRAYWPLTLRQVHYRLLTLGVPRNARTGLAYANDARSYADLSDLLTRARLDGLVPWESMHDPTRPRTGRRTWAGAGAYAREALDSFLTGYRRDLLRGQPAYVELVVEKLTVQDVAERAAAEFGVPVGVGRGYASATALDETAERFFASGKGAFVLLIAGDLDPEGEDICRAWAACLRDEHGVPDLTVVKVAVNPDQVAGHALAPVPVKDGSSRAAGYRAAHGGRAYELEAFEPDVLQGLMRDAVRSTLDLGAFEAEREREAEDARELLAFRRTALELLRAARPPGWRV